MVTALMVVAASAFTAGAANAATPPANDDIGGATVIGSLPFSATQDSLTATNAPTDPTPSCGAPNGSSVWYSYTPPANQTIAVGVTGGDGFPPIVTAYTGPAAATAGSTLTEAACATSSLQFNVTGGTTYYFLLGSYTPRPSFTFNVQVVVPPANDDIGGAMVIGSLPFSATQDSLTATNAPTDPTPSCGAPNGSSVWYAYTPSTDQAITTGTTRGDYFPPIVTVYTGPAGATSGADLTEAACSTSSLQFNLTAGTTYYFLLGSYSPRPSFTFTVQAVVPPANDRIDNATSIGSLPFSATQDSLTATYDPQDPSPSCSPNNAGNVWYSWTPTANATIQANTTGGNGFPPIVTAYTGPVGATSGADLTEAACSTSGLQFNVTAGTTYYFMLSGTDPTFTFTVGAIIPPPNDDISGATVIGSLPYTATQDTLTATSAPTDPIPSCGAPNRFTVWYAYTAAADGLIQISTSSTDYSQPLATAYSGPAGATTTSPLTEVACSTYLPLQVSATAGTTYYFLLGSNLPAGTFTLQVGPGVPFAAPQITAPAVAADTDPGVCSANVTFGGLVVTGNPTPSVQVFPGSASGGNFAPGTTQVTVRAFNALGFTSTSFPVTVTDHEKPQIETPDGVTVDATQASGAVVTYPTSTASDNCPGVSVTSSPASGTRFKIGRTTVTVIATDASGNQSTSTFVVQVDGAHAQLLQLAKAVTGVGVGHSLEVTVRIAETQRDHGHLVAACQTLSAFELQVAAQSPAFIDVGTAAALEAQAQQIRTVLKCRP